ncbi:hypothetical protein UG55_11551, partial [Frankia sp. EI5c]
PISDVARELGILEGTLGVWVAAYRRAHADETGVSCEACKPKVTKDRPIVTGRSERVILWHRM